MSTDPTPPPWVRPVTLEGRSIRLEPLSLEHVSGLTEAGADPAIWRWYIIPPRTTKALMLEWVEEAMANAASGSEQAFATVDRFSGRVLGSTRYMSIVPAHRRLEIGSTWLTPAAQRTAANSESKLLLLDHAFAVLDARRVEFKTDANNEASRAALLAIGATFEGIHRRHMVRWDDGNRDSAWYSIVDEEWPAVRPSLAARVDARLAAATTDLPSSSGRPG